MSNGPLINVCPAVQIVIGATKIDIYTAYDTMIHGTEPNTTPGDMLHTHDKKDTMIHNTTMDEAQMSEESNKDDITEKDTMLFDEKVTKWLAAQKDDTTHTMPLEDDTTMYAATEEDTCNSTIQRQDTNVPLKRKRYIRKKRVCPIPGCIRNNTPLLLSDHLLHTHKLPKGERMYWLRKQ